MLKTIALRFLFRNPEINAASRSIRIHFGNLNSTAGDVRVADDLEVLKGDVSATDADESRNANAVQSLDLRVLIADNMEKSKNGEKGGCLEI